MGISDKEFRELTFTGILEEDIKIMQEILGNVCFSGWTSTRLYQHKLYDWYLKLPLLFLL